MKVNVVIDSISRSNGGLFDAERGLHRALVPMGINATIFGLSDEFANADATAWKPLKPQVFSADSPAFLGRSPGLYHALLAERADLIYRAGLWKWPSRYAFEWSRKHEKPEIIAPHGMLDPWAVKNSAWKKRLVLLCYERKHLGDAACIRALSEAEAQAIRAFGLNNPICIVPNGVDVAESGKQKTQNGNTPWNAVIEPGRKVLLYLGRIHPKKGLVNLVKAWAAVQKTEDRWRMAKEWTLVIAGWDQGGHEDELQQLATELSIGWADVSEERAEDGRATMESHPSTLNSQRAASLLFIGPQFDEDRAACFANCDAFILPSFSEGLPMAVLEAWACCKAVLMTPQCNLPEGFLARAALSIEPNADSIAQGLRELFEMPCASRSAFGARGRALVASRFTWPKIATDIRAVYEWVLGGRPKPDCVRLD